MLPLAPSAIEHLEHVYRRYMNAVPGHGELQKTASELHDACKALGWNPTGVGREGYLPWAREKLGVTDYV